MSGINCHHCGATAETHKSVTCVICSNSFKIECVDVSNTEARKIHSKSSGLSWTCAACRQFGNDLNSLRSAIVALQNEIKTLKESAQQPPTSSALSPIDVEGIVREVSDRERRKTNIIIYGCQESRCATNMNQLEIDKVEIKELFTSIDLDEENIGLARLGKFVPNSDNNRRPIKVTLSSEAKVLSVLRSAAGLRRSERWGRIAVSRDQTVMQREIYRGARTELEGRLAGGETNIRIRYKNGIPSVVSFAENQPNPTG